LSAGVAVVGPVATGRATKGDFIDVATGGAFLTPEAIDEVEVIIEAIGKRLPAQSPAHLIICRTGVDTSDEIGAIEVRGTRLKFVVANSVESTRLAGGTIHRRVTCACSRACTIEARDARETNITASAAICFIRFDVDAFSTALGQTRAARGGTSAIGADIALGTGFVAHAAIARVEFQVDADAIAFRRAAGALRVACAIGANLAHGANNAACAAIAGIVFRVDTRIGAFRRAARTIECAFAARTHFARAANGAARTAI
jgi:hypothetical protein